MQYNTSLAYYGAPTDISDYIGDDSFTTTTSRSELPGWGSIGNRVIVAVHDDDRLIARLSAIEIHDRRFDPDAVRPDGMSAAELEMFEIAAANWHRLGPFDPGYLISSIELLDEDFATLIEFLVHRLVDQMPLQWDTFFAIRIPIAVPWFRNDAFADWLRTTFDCRFVDEGTGFLHANLAADTSPDSDPEWFTSPLEDLPQTEKNSDASAR